MLRRLAQGAVLVAGAALLAFAWRSDGPWVQKHVFLPQQFFIAASPALGTWARGAAAGLGALLLLSLPLLPRGAAGRRVLLALLLAAIAAEGALRWRMRRLAHPELAAEMRALTAPDPRYGQTLASGIDVVLPLSGRNVRVRTDAARRRVPEAAVDPALPSLIFTGESTVAGMGLQWEETFAAILGKRLRLQPVNLASPAYRADQSLLRLRDALPGLAHPVAVIGIFMPGLIGRSFAGQLHPPAPGSGPPAAPGLLQRSGLYQLWRHLYWSDVALEEGMRSVGAALRDMAALARSRGAPCIFLVTGHTPPWMVRELFDLPVLDYVIAEVPEGELLADGHPGPLGSARIADALEARLRTTLVIR